MGPSRATADFDQPPRLRPTTAPTKAATDPGPLRLRSTTATTKAAPPLLGFGGRCNTRGVGVVMAGWDRDRVPVGMGGPGRRGWRLVEERVAYLALVNEGMGVREAARMVGINCRTAKTWNAAARAAGTGRAAGSGVTAPDSAGRVISARYLSRRPVARATSDDAGL